MDQYLLFTLYYYKLLRLQLFRSFFEMSHSIVFCIYVVIDFVFTYWLANTVHLMQ